MAELVYAQGLKPCAARHEGSNPSPPTTLSVLQSAFNTSTIRLRIYVIGFSLTVFVPHCGIRLLVNVPEAKALSEVEVIVN
jgi:hypothetical protein